LARQKVVVELAVKIDNHLTKMEQVGKALDGLPKKNGLAVEAKSFPLALADDVSQ
jgi:hypothetical protein